MKDFEKIGFTKQRLTVLQVIQESEKHLTANEVFNNARELLPGISFATVYNSLHYLKNKGLIGEIWFGTAVARYDRRITRHDHALCKNCGKLVDMELSIPAELIREASRFSNFQPESIELTLHGLCPDCI